MKYFIQIIASILIFVSFLANGNLKFAELLSFEEFKIPIYIDDESTQKLKLTMSYGSAVIQNPEEISVIKNAIIGTIDIICTDDPAGAEFSGLTRKRVERVKKLLPEEFNNEKINWRFFRQTKCKDKSSAEQLFHGIVITYRLKQTEESMKKEIEYLEGLFTPDTIPAASSSETGVTTYSSALRSSDPSTWIVDTTYKSGDTTYIFYGYSSTDSITYSFPTFIPFVDSTVSAVLNRQHWNDMSITADVTGSMSPYTAQLLIWLELNTKDSKAKQFVFFNDGDMKPDKAKVIGKTGGIYSERLKDFDSVKKLATKAMFNGCGGDAPENDLEALKNSIKSCPECEQILIADNWAPIKDISLLDEITKPVRIILCGTQLGINTDYLNLARATGGSLHTMEKDLTELALLNEGEEVTIGKETFKIMKGRFVKTVKS